MVEALTAQIVVLTDELNSVKNELVQIKAAHRTLHQQSVDANSQQGRLMNDQLL